MAVDGTMGPMRHYAFLLVPALALVATHCGGVVNPPDEATVSPRPTASSIAAEPPKPALTADAPVAPSAVATTSSSAVPVKPPQELKLKWTVLEKGYGLYWLAGELVSVVATAAPVGATGKTRVEIAIERLGAGKGKPPTKYSTILNGHKPSGDINVRPTGTDWDKLESSAFLQVSSTGYVTGTSTFDGRKWARWTYETAGPAAAALQAANPPPEGPWCSVDIQERRQTLSPELAFRAEACIVAFEPSGGRPAIAPPAKLSGMVSAVAESATVVWLADPGASGRIYRWEAGAWTSTPLPKEMGRYSLLLDHRPGLGLIAISDHDTYAKIEIEPAP